MEQVASATERHALGQLGEVRASLAAVEERTERWRVTFEDAESKRLLELHAAMKILNSNFQKVSRDGKDRFQLLQREFQAFDGALRNQLHDMKHKLQQELAQFEERAEQAMARQVMKGAGVPIGGGAGVNNLELDMMMNGLREEMKAYTERVVF